MHINDTNKMKCSEIMSLIMLLLLCASFAIAASNSMSNVHHHKFAFVASSSSFGGGRQSRNLSSKQQQVTTSLNMVEEKDYVSPMRKRPPPLGGDVAYNNENILRQQRHYNDIRKVGGSDCVTDIYAQDPNTEDESNIRYWFVGKVSRCTGTVSEELAIARQINLIEEHACRIRPVELGRSFGNLDFYLAPGDTELRTTQNDPGIRLMKVQKNVDGAENVPLLEVGLDLSIVTNRGEGLYVVRTKDGIVPPHLMG